MRDLSLAHILRSVAAVSFPIWLRTNTHTKQNRKLASKQGRQCAVCGIPGIIRHREHHPALAASAGSSSWSCTKLTNSIGKSYFVRLTHLSTLQIKLCSASVMLWMRSPPPPAPPAAAPPPRPHGLGVCDVARPVEASQPTFSHTQVSQNLSKICCSTDGSIFFPGANPSAHFQLGSQGTRRGSVSAPSRAKYRTGKNGVAESRPESRPVTKLCFTEYQESHSLRLWGAIKHPPPPRDCKANKFLLENCK
ncbi:uncharacterized protein [Physcomitrium patens]|uniref:Uncharacterized protein n=2 Tax=Physcomitrium patens TaxID=3218 RepID=A0A7I3Z5T8_PHYPA